MPETSQTQDRIHNQGNRMKVFLVLRNLCIIPKSTLRSQ
ncbi:MAG: hypothetical protein BECKG1743D_GA0114223_113052, partial [Candidatus Kentron sp. G]